MRATTTTIKYRERSIRWRAKCRTYALIPANIRRVKERHDPPENRTVNFRSKDLPDDRISRSRYRNLWLWLAQLLWKRGQAVFRLNSTRWPRFCWHLSMGEPLGRIRYLREPAVLRTCGVKNACSELFQLVERCSERYECSIFIVLYASILHLQFHHLSVIFIPNITTNDRSILRNGLRKTDTEAGRK